MQTREELLSGLNDATSLIKQLAGIQQRLNQVRSQYKRLAPHKEMGKLAKFILIVIILNGVLNLLNFSIAGLFLSVVQAVIAYVVIKFIYQKRNEKIDKDNQHLVAENENIKVQEQDVLNDLQKVQAAYRERVASWYPANYCSVEAVEFFHNAVKNYRADNIKEAINLYETFLHQRRMEDNQKQAIQQQKLNNLLAVGSLAMQGMALGEMSRHNATAEFEMQKANRTLDNIRNGY